ncbi:helix-turn-helix transcriptional regulator [Methylohalomonas lacus]|nr:AlpA family transcriptional regulator [Methylohalomonas lacus]
MPEVCEKIGMGRTAVYDLMEHKGFPRPVRLSSRYVAWSEAEVDEWINQRLAERDDTINA